jgi:cytochrome c-type biogenesis protein CcmE
LAVFVLIVALAALVTLLLRPGLSPYLAVDELTARADELRNTEIRLAGYLASPVTLGENSTATFTVATRGTVIPVVLTDRVPPGLKDGAEVLLDGRLDHQGTFHAHRLMTQCASRYSDRLKTAVDGADAPAAEVK